MAYKEQPKKVHSESGRSLLEMLGTLAVMALISAGGVIGYSSAMRKHEANELAHRLMVRAMDLSTQATTGQEPSLSSWNPHDGKYAIPTQDVTSTPTTFTLTALNIPKSLCERMHALQLPVTSITPEPINCTQTTDMTFTFNKDLRERNAGNSAGGSGAGGGEGGNSEESGNEESDACIPYQGDACIASCSVVDEQVSLTYNEGANCGTNMVCDNNGTCICNPNIANLQQEAEGCYVDACATFTEDVCKTGCTSVAGEAQYTLAAAGTRCGINMTCQNDGSCDCANSSMSIFEWNSGKCCMPDSYTPDEGCSMCQDEFETIYLDFIEAEEGNYSVAPTGTQRVQCQLYDLPNQISFVSSAYCRNGHCCILPGECTTNDKPYFYCRKTNEDGICISWSTCAKRKTNEEEIYGIPNATNACANSSQELYCAETDSQSRCKTWDVCAIGKSSGTRIIGKPNATGACAGTGQTIVCQGCSYYDSGCSSCVAQ